VTIARLVRTAAVSAALAIIATGCSNDNAPAATGATTTPTATATAQSAAYEYQIEAPKYDSDVIHEYGQAEAAAAYEVALSFSKLTFDEDRMAPHQVTRADFDGLDSLLTESADADWQKTLTKGVRPKATSEDKSALSTVGFNDFHFNGTLTPRAPLVQDLSISKSSVLLEPGGTGRILVRTTIAGELRYLDTGKPMLQPVDKQMSYWLKRVTVDGQQVWRIDGWQGTYNFREPHADPAVTE
jgi:hypothetical protein